MNAGKLKHKIVIQNFTKVSDGFGGYEENWNDYKTIWANIEPLSGKEFIQAQQTQTEYSHRVRTRFYNDIKDTMRIKYKNRLLKIESVINVEERNRELEIMCTETSE